MAQRDEHPDRPSAARVDPEGEFTGSASLAAGEFHATPAGAMLAGAATGGVIGLAAGLAGAAVGAIGGAIVGAIAERLMHTGEESELHETVDASARPRLTRRIADPDALELREEQLRAQARRRAGRLDSRDEPRRPEAETRVIGEAWIVERRPVHREAAGAAGLGTPREIRVPLLAQDVVPRERTETMDE
jgi:hypothetical protein